MTTAKETKQERPIDAVIRVRNSRRRPVSVDALGITLYFAPMTQAAMDAAEEHMSAPVEGENAVVRQSRRNMVLLIMQAEMEDGSRAFAFGDIETIRQNMDYFTLQNLITEMFTSTMPATKDEAKKD